jgi:hypothetical protein
MVQDGDRDAAHRLLRDTQENKVPIADFPSGALLRVGGASP